MITSTNNIIFVYLYLMSFTNCIFQLYLKSAARPKRVVTVCESSPSSPLWRVPTTSLLISIWNWSSIIIIVVVVIIIIANIINTIFVVNINIFIIKIVIFPLETDSPLTSLFRLVLFPVFDGDNHDLAFSILGTGT